jgi:uncharacterized oxidoreductase
MNTNRQVVLVTGGGSGIGFELAKKFSLLGNEVILVGRNRNKLISQAAQLSNTKIYVCDITSEDEVNGLVQFVKDEFGGLSILVNNAGVANIHSLAVSGNSFHFAQQEIETNYLSAVRLTEKLLPLLMQRKEAAIMNNSSVVALVPAASLATYSASKAALHSYTQSLRIALQKSTQVKVFELMPPLVDTEFARKIPGQKITAEEVAEAAIYALQNDIFEIHVASTSAIYKLFLSSPELALKQINRLN